MLLRKVTNYIKVKEKNCEFGRNFAAFSEKFNFTLCFEFAFAKVQTCKCCLIIVFLHNKVSSKL